MWDLSKSVLGATLSIKDPESTQILLQPSPARAMDRKFFIESLSSLAVKEHYKSSQDLVSQFVLALSDPNIDWINFLIKSVFSKGTHIWMAEQSWLVEGIRRSSANWSYGLKSAIEEEIDTHVDVFLSAYSQHLSHEAVIKVHQASSQKVELTTNC